MGRLRRVTAPLLGVTVALALLVDTRGLDQAARGGQLGPGFWPRLALLGLGLACVAKAVTEWRQDRAARPARPMVDAETLERETLPEISRRKLATAIGLIVLYVLGTPAVGFPLATAAFILAFMYLCGTRSVPALAANAAIGTVLFLYLFIKLVYLPLPKGEGPFETVTLALYQALHIF